MDEMLTEEEDCDCETPSDGLDLQVMTSRLKTKGVKRRKQVLDEDLYVEQIEKIIERDFFPDLVKLREQNQIRDNRTEPKFAVERHLLSQQSPATFETPIHTNEATIGSQLDGQQLEEDNQPKNQGLDQFLNKYTSEDNASFEQIQEQEMRKHCIKYKWLYKDGKNNNTSVKQLLELPSIERQAIGDQSTDASVVTWNYTNQNSVMYNPPEAPLSDEQKLANIKRQEVIHENTRFRTTPFNERVNQMTIALAAQLSARQKEGKIGIDGKELVTKETPEINGFKFVASTPTPAPDLCSESPFMTWGEIEGTPFSLSGAETPSHPGLTPGASQFKIPDLPQREKIGISLATKAAKLHRDRKKKAFKTVQSSLSIPSPRSFKTPLERLKGMSPAAQTLATKKLGVHQNIDTTLMASYSPARTPLRTPERTSSLTPKPLLSGTSLTPKQILNEKTFSDKFKRTKAQEFF